MGYFDGIVDASFKSTKEENLLFYPFGVLGKGYVLPDITKKQEIRNKLKVFYKVTFSVVIPLNPIILLLAITHRITWWLAILFYLGLSGGLTLYGFYITKNWVKELLPTSEKLTLAESYSNSGKSHNIIFLWVMEVFSILIILSAIFMLWTMVSDHQAWLFRSNYSFRILSFVTTLVSIPLCGLCAFIIGYMIKSKSRK